MDREAKRAARWDAYITAWLAGYEEGDGNIGRTYDDPDLNEAYDQGRTQRRVALGLEERGQDNG